MSTSWWMQNAWVDSAPVPSVRLVTDGEQITQLLTGVAPCDGDTIVEGLILPGFANVHSHVFHRALRGASATGSSFWAWREVMYRVACRLTPDSYYSLALAAYQEMLRGGYTSVGEFHYLHHQADGSRYDDPNAMGLALIAAARDAGIRITLLDTAYFSSGFGAAPTPVQRRFCDASAHDWAERVSLLSSDRTTRIGAAIHSIRAVDPAQAHEVSQWAAGQSVPLHVHLSEQVAENDECLRRWSVTPTRLLAEAGVWSSRATAVHATHLGEPDVAILAQAGAVVGLCPSTEADLADGFPPLASYLDHGAELAVGSDQNVSSDGLAEAQAVDAGLRLLTRRRDGLGAADLVTMLGAAGQRSLGWTQAGRIAVGALADWVVVGLGSPRLAGTELPEVPRIAVAADITEVVVAGHVVARPDADSDTELAARIDRLCRETRSSLA